ncbi:MAG: hypothetical protein ACXW3Z_16245, partial [Limisphaerales bacterium]
MRSRASIDHGALPNLSDAKPFRMLSIYDSEAANREATDTSNLVLRELGDTIEADRTIWNLDSLDTSNLRQLAAEEAARADVIVIALAGNEPSKSLKQWAAQWQQSRELSGGLLALIPAGDSESGGDLADFLYETAVSANMDFLCQKKSRA